MSAAKLEIALRQRLDKNKNPYFMGNNEMDVNIKDTVLFIFPKTNLNSTDLEKQFADKVITKLELDDPDASDVSNLVELFREFFREKTDGGAAMVIENHDEDKRAS